MGIFESNVLSKRSASKDWLLLPMPFFVYILRSSANQLYIGQTSNLDNREEQHLTKDWKAAKFTKDGNGFVLVYHEEHPSRLDAMRREAQLKGWTRAKKEALISGNKDLLKNLSKSKQISKGNLK
jgi:predicted GIY-YIG superfamily endonuclease